MVLIQEISRTFSVTHWPILSNLSLTMTISM